MARYRALLTDLERERIQHGRYDDRDDQIARSKAVYFARSRIHNKLPEDIQAMADGHGGLFTDFMDLVRDDRWTSYLPENGLDAYREQMDTPDLNETNRALMTDLERERIGHGRYDDEQENNHRNVAISNVRGRITEKLANDLEVLAEHQPEVFSEFMVVARHPQWDDYLPDSRLATPPTDG